MKVGSRVRVTHKEHYSGLVGRIVSEEYDTYWVLFNHGERGKFYNGNNLELVKPSFSSLLVGDEIESKSGSKARVLEVGRNSFLRTDWGSNLANMWTSFDEVEVLGLKVVGGEEITEKQMVQDIKNNLEGVIKCLEKI